MYPRQGFLKHASICCENAQADPLMNFGSKRESLTVHQAEQEMQKATEQAFPEQPRYAPSAAFVRLSDF
jgi:hypothetical protein